MPRFGTVKRQYPRVEVLRGFNPNEPHTFTQAFPVADGVSVYSGQVISLAVDNDYEGGHKWVLGLPDATKIPYIALNDWVPTQGLGVDPDVIEAGKLVGLSCAGQFEIQTAWWSDGSGSVQDMGSSGDFAVDVPLTNDAGSVAATITGSGAPIIGYVTRHTGVKNIGPSGSGNNGQDSSAIADHLYVVTFQTAYDRNPS